MNPKTSFDFLGASHLSNPFDPHDSDQANLVGREDDVAWLIDGLGKGVPLSLHGPEEFGKPSLVFHASLQLGNMRATALFQVDLADFQNAGDFVQLLDGSAAAFARQPPGPNLSLVGHTREGSEHSANIFSAMDRFNTVAEARNQKFIFAMSGYEKLSTFESAGLPEQLAASVRAHRKIAFVFSGDFGSQESSPVSVPNLEGILQPRTLQPTNPFRLAAWIDAKFATAGIAAAAIGEACVECGGPSVKEIFELARETFLLARALGTATERTVQQAIKRKVGEHRLFLAASWESLSFSERETFAHLAHHQESPFKARPGPGKNLANSVSVQFALESLRRKKLVNVMPDGTALASSSLFRHWGMQAEIGLELNGKTSTELKKTSLHLGFRFSAEINATLPRKCESSRGIFRQQ